MLIDLEPLLGILTKNIVQTSENNLGAKMHIMGMDRLSFVHEMKSQAAIKIIFSKTL